MYKLIFVFIIATHLCGCDELSPCFIEKGHTNMVLDKFEYRDHLLEMYGRSVTNDEYCELKANCSTDLEYYLEIGDTIVKDSGSRKIVILGKHKITYYDKPNETSEVKIVERIP